MYALVIWAALFLMDTCGGLSLFQSRSFWRIKEKHYLYCSSSPSSSHTEKVAGDEAGNTPLASATFKRRVRYAGSYPRGYAEKYKERRGDEAVVAKVIAKGGTPASTHIPIMLEECLEHMGLNKEADESSSLFVVDCTLGYGGHSSAIMRCLRDKDTLLAIDQDPVEIKKTEQRLRDKRTNNATATLIVENLNFALLHESLKEKGKIGEVDCLLADLGYSSMQIDNDERGFSYKTEGPLDMRMNTSANSETAYELLKRLKISEFEKMLRENSDEQYSELIAREVLGGGVEKIPKTTLAFADVIRRVVKTKSGLPKDQLTKKFLDATVARSMQALRIEINGEFRALESLLKHLPNILSKNGGRAVFLTFHSGEDRRVKKALKSGFNAGLFSAWSRDVIRASASERRANGRSSCCKLRWCIRA